MNEEEKKKRSIVGHAGLKPVRLSLNGITMKQEALIYNRVGSCHLRTDGTLLCYVNVLIINIKMMRKPA